MQALQPEMKATSREIQLKRSKDTAKITARNNGSVSKTWRKSNGRLFSIIVQMPVLIGFYHAISRTREIAER